MLSILEHLIDPRACIPHAYRVCALGREGQIASYVEVEADDDAEAIHLSQPLGAFYAVELWDGPRFLARFGPGEAVQWGPPEPSFTITPRPAVG